MSLILVVVRANAVPHFLQRRAKELILVGHCHELILESILTLFECDEFLVEVGPVVVDHDLDDLDLFLQQGHLVVELLLLSQQLTPFVTVTLGRAFLGFLAVARRQRRSRPLVAALGGKHLSRSSGGRLFPFFFG